ncbi:MAG: hypothetical protein P0S95_03105 [Rhabdochlamydiaceae bacterium]|nr:hypothetical protein [Candidatus Amphrikana amoebophyrae]
MAAMGGIQGAPFLSKAGQKSFVYVQECEQEVQNRNKLIKTLVSKQLLNKVELREINRRGASHLLATSAIETPFAKDHATPKLFAVYDIADHYRKKLNVEIFVVSSQEAADIIKDKAQQSDCKPFGIIIVREKTSHVTPIFCHPSKKDGKLYTLVMDSIGQNDLARDVTDDIVSKVNKNCVVGVSLKLRQASSTGCRIDAFSSLKYAINTCRSENVEHMPDFLSLDSGEVLDSNNGVHSTLIFIVPSCWAPAAQVLTGVDRKYDHIIVNKKGATILDKWQRHTYRTASKVRIYLLNSENQIIDKTVVKETRNYIAYKERHYLSMVTGEKVQAIVEEPLKQVKISKLQSMVKLVKGLFK